MLETLYKPEDTDERCGIVLKSGEVIEVANLAEDKTDSYIMDPTAIAPLLAADEVAGTWHTHPGGSPNLSGEDYSGFLDYPDLEHTIIGVRDGTVVAQRYIIKDGLVVACD